MKKIISMMAVLLVCLSLAYPVSAVENTFVPSISYKDGPEIEDAEMNDEKVSGCLIVSSITDAKNKATDIYQEDRDLLLDVYAELDDGAMKLPLENDKYVIRELVDVSFQKTSCVETDHSHKERLAQEDTSVTIRFDLGIGKNAEIVVMAYVDGAWEPIKSVKNNGDGTVTCVFEDICPVAFCVEESTVSLLPKTGDTVGRNLGLWIGLMAGSLAAILVLLLYRRKHKQ